MGQRLAICHESDARPRNIRRLIPEANVRFAGYIDTAATDAQPDIIDKYEQHLGIQLAFAVFIAATRAADANDPQPQFPSCASITRERTAIACAIAVSPCWYTAFLLGGTDTDYSALMAAASECKEGINRKFGNLAAETR